MPVNDQRVIEIVFQNIEKIESRYEGYTKELQSLVADVMLLERDHEMQKTNIKQLISEKISMYAEELFERTK